jgi:hypothetical protein
MSTAGWQRAATYQRFYNKAIIVTDSSSDMVDVLLFSV